MCRVLLWSVCLLLAVPLHAVAELPIRVVEDKQPGSLRLWHLYERTDATALVGEEVTLVGRFEPGQTVLACDDPPWFTVAFSREKKPGADRPDTFQAFVLECGKRPLGLDAVGLARCTGKLRVNRPEWTTEAKSQQRIPVFRIELAKVAPIPCRRSLAELRTSAATDIRGVEARLRALCAKHGLHYALDDSQLAYSFYQGRIACTTIVSQHPAFSFKPVPYATISALYQPESGALTGFVFMLRVWQDPPD